MNLLQKLKEQKKLPLLLLLLLLGVALVAVSYMSGPLENSGQKTMQDSVEVRLAYVLSRIDGAGQVDVLVMEEEEGDVLGVIVVAEGAQDLSVRTQLTRAAMTALDIEAESVEVFARMEE